MTDTDTYIQRLAESNVLGQGRHLKIAAQQFGRETLYKVTAQKSCPDHRVALFLGRQSTLGNIDNTDQAVLKYQLSHLD